ncbi:zinc finger CCCH domain-containing protein 15 isoform X1 [Dermacentor silvarum]|uniref:zinc finger CCCH domain-containing protein 15 isoform X1 n=1 Tax=Dermacentor silvarum TaxID=543639 RepID=UPI0018987F6A|nr:zinc finger CCCH domain-containing protein 15 isoform X1 [Dermacentor silvarum]
MPPKKKAPEPSKKTEMKKKEKVIEDKTFGLKNKKGAKTQKFIQQVQHQVKFGNQPAKKVEALAKNEKKKTETEDLNQLLFRPVQKVEKGADPKSVLCAFFKQGTCGKGDKCKFSHDLTIERKAEKRDIYTDMRDQDTMDNWDEAKLAEVVEKKHGEAERRLPKTDIICKHFLDALEQNKYGWFWECPNGGQKCHYRHAVPPGFVLKKNKKNVEENKTEDTLTIEDLIETERAKIGGNLPRITLESFLAWKKAKIREKQDTEQKERDRKRDEFKAGRSIGLSGRDMFTFRPELAEDDGQDEEGEEAYDLSRFDGEEDNVEVIREITLENLMAESLQSGDLAAAAASPIEASMATSVPIDEKLFEDDDLEDLEELEDELEELAIK